MEIYVQNFLLPLLAGLTLILFWFAAKTAWEQTSSTLNPPPQSTTNKDTSSNNNRQNQQNGLTSEQRNKERNKWLKEKGFQASKRHENPFIVGSPVRYDQFFGREEILQRLFDLWKGFPSIPIQNVAIYGERRIGKTSLLLHLKDIMTALPPEVCLREGQKTGDEWLPNSKNYSFIFVDFQDVELCNKKRLLEYILRNMPLEKKEKLDLSLSRENPLLDFSQIVSHYLVKPTIILLDEIDAALERYPKELDNAFWEGLRAIATTKLEPQCLGFVLASDKHPIELGKRAAGAASPFFNIFGYVTKLGPLTKDAAKELIASSPKSFSEEDIDFILEKSERKPHLLQLFCQKRLQFNHDDWQQEVEEHLGQMKATNTQEKNC